MMDAAITREKQLKNRRRAWKLILIEAADPRWSDLAEEMGFGLLTVILTFVGMTVRNRAIGVTPSSG